MWREALSEMCIAAEYPETASFIDDIGMLRKFDKHFAVFATWFFSGGVVMVSDRMGLAFVPSNSL